MFASGSNASLFGFGSGANLECGGVPRVASLDMLRNMVDQDEKNRSIKRNEGTVQFTGAPEQPGQSPQSLRQQPGPNAQLFQPSGSTIPHPAQSLAQSASLCLCVVLLRCRRFRRVCRARLLTLTLEFTTRKMFWCRCSPARSIHAFPAGRKHFSDGRNASSSGYSAGLPEPATEPSALASSRRTARASRCIGLRASTLPLWWWPL